MVVFINIAENPNEEYDIEFQTSNNISLKMEELTEIEKNLYKEIEYTNNIIKSLKHTKNEVKRKYFNKLLSLSQAAYLSNSPNPQLAQMSLEVLIKEMLLVEGERIKNRYMLLLGIGAICSIIMSWFLYFALAVFWDVTTWTIYFNVWSGTMIGTWISFGARKFIIQFDDLSDLEKDKMNIYIRLPYIGICALVLVLFINSGIFSFEIGNISTENLNGNPKIQILIGVVAGLFESKLGVKIHEKAEDIVNKM